MTTAEAPPLEETPDDPRASDVFPRGQVVVRGIELRAVLMATATAVVMIERDTLVFANDRASRLFGYAPEELAGLPLATLLPDIARKCRPHPTGEAPSDAPTELRARRRDGSEVEVEVSLCPIAREGETPLVLAFVADVTRRREGDKRIRDYQARLQRVTFEASVAEERERRRIAFDLHDRIGQLLVLAKLKLGSVGDASGASRGAIDEACALLDRATVDMRSLTFDLSPPILYDLGLGAAVRWLAGDYKERFGLEVEVDDALPPIDETTAVVLFRSVRELLMNAFKHACVPSVRVSLRRTSDRIHVTVRDEGVGFVAADESVWSSGSGFGLFSVREQVRRLGGAMEIASAPGRGTLVVMEVPLEHVAA